MINPDGTGLREIADLGRGYVLFPAWNHLGDQIAIAFRSYESGQYDLWTLDIDLTDEGEPYVAGSRIVCGDPVDEETAPSWSPDDTQLVFARIVHGKRGTTDQIVKFDLPSSTEIVLVSDKKKWLKSPDWCPVIPAK
jgi:Tol biopolymer transport system component